MTALMVRCPSTGRELSTGIDTDGIDHLPKVGTRMRCPLCGEEHFWTSKGRMVRGISPRTSPASIIGPSSMET